MAGEASRIQPNKAVVVLRISSAVLLSVGLIALFSVPKFVNHKHSQVHSRKSSEIEKLVSRLQRVHKETRKLTTRIVSQESDSEEWLRETLETLSSLRQEATDAHRRLGQKTRPNTTPDSLDGSSTAVEDAVEQIEKLNKNLEVVQSKAADQQDAWNQVNSKLAETERRASELVKQYEQQVNEVDRLNNEKSFNFNRVLSAAEADRHQLARVLESHPEWLKKRREEIARQPARGIVVAAGGGTLLANAFVHMHVLRHHLRCTLPITVMYWGEEESLPDSAKTYFQGSLDDVSFLDASQLAYPLYQRPLAPRTVDGQFIGWKPKIAAIYNAPYQQVLFLDADSMPLLDPSFLFDWPDYNRTGSMFFPEHYVLEVELFRYFGLHNPWAVPTEGGGAAEELQTESGQLLLNRSVHADVLEWLWFLNTHDEVTYRVAHGDKDTFRAAFDLAGKRESFYQVPVRNVDALQMRTNTEGFSYVKQGVVQLAPNGTLAFVHRVWFTKYDIKKWEPRGFDHLTAQMSALGTGHGLAAVLTPDRCALDTYDVIRSQQECGADVKGEDAPVPVFPLPPASHVARAQRAADDVFGQLKIAVEAGEVQLS